MHAHDTYVAMRAACKSSRAETESTGAPGPYVVKLLAAQQLRLAIEIASGDCKGPNQCWPDSPCSAHR